MEFDNSIKDNPQFQDKDWESGRIFSIWLERCGIDTRTVLAEIQEYNPLINEIGAKSFRQWTCCGESSRRVSGSTPEIRGDRLVAIVRWFVREHRHRSKPVVQLDELKTLMALYEDIPVKNRLQIYRIVHEFKIEAGERSLDSLFFDDWRRSLEEWPAFAFVVDRYWCIRASNHYEMALVGHKQEDLTCWGWWHRLVSTRKGKTKFTQDSEMRSLRGPYATTYYRWQMLRFIADTEQFRQGNDERYELLMSYLRKSPDFEEIWQACLAERAQHPSGSASIPVPFFRDDGTLLWMLEVSSLIPGTDDYRLVLWSPLNAASDEYLAEIRRWADEPGRFDHKAYFIEDFARYFSEEERFVLGVI
jgi:hypothetical protein